MANPANPEKRGFLNPRFLNSKTGRIIGIGAITIGSTIAALPFFDHGLTRAEVKPAQSEPFKKAAVEILQVYQYEIEFDFGGDHYYWGISNGTWGIYPPNDPERDIGTVRVAKNNDFINFTSFQPLGSLYAEETQQGPGIRIVIGGMAVNTRLDKYYLGTDTSTNTSGIFVPFLELGSGIKTPDSPDSYANRTRVKKGWPKEIYGNSSQYITAGADVNGNWARQMFDNCVNPLENGTYEIRLDNSGNPIGDTAKKLSNSINPNLPYQNFLPIITRNQ